MIVAFRFVQLGICIGWPVACVGVGADIRVGFGGFVCGVVCGMLSGLIFVWEQNQ